LVETPMIRKDFIVDEYQIYQAKLMGADAVLLICAILSSKEIERYILLCDQLGMSALVEVHDEAEIAVAVEAGAGIIGVNNRDLKDFTVDTGNSSRLRRKVPEDVIFIAESGVKGRKDTKALAAAGVDGVLVGEALMRAKDKAAMVKELRADL